MQFFSETKREVALDPPAQMKLNAQNERRIKVMLTMLLTPDSLQGAPLEVDAALQAVGLVSNGITKSVISTEFEHVDIEFSPLPDKAKAAEIKDATVRGLYVSRKIPKDGAPTEVFLHMATTVPYSKKLWSYVGDNGGATLWVTFFNAQPELAEEQTASQPQESEPAQGKPSLVKPRGRRELIKSIKKMQKLTSNLEQTPF